MNLLVISELLQVLDRRETVLPPDDSQQDSAVRLVAEDPPVVGPALLELAYHPLDRLGGHLGAHVAVERARGAALLHVAQHVHPRAEDVLPLFRVQAVQEIGCVVWVRVLIPV